MKEEEFKQWAKRVNGIINAKIILDRLKEKKKISRAEYNKINIKIKDARHKTHLNSPHFEGRPELKKRATLLALKDYMKYHNIK